MSEPLDALVCVNHPNTPTRLRCAKCNAPICTRCARSTPTGYICPACQKGLQKRFEVVTWYDYLLVAVLGGAGGLVGSLFVPLVASLFYGILLIFYAPFIGKVTARLIQAALRRHRGRRLFQTAAAAFVLGGLPYLLFNISILWLLYPQGWQMVWGSLLAIGYQVIYIFLGAYTLLHHLKGLSF